MPKDLSTKAEEDTIRVAKTVGIKKSTADLFTMRAGKHTLSAGMSNGILTYPSTLHKQEKEEDRERAHVKASSGKTDATVTVRISSIVHMLA